MSSCYLNYSLHATRIMDLLGPKEGTFYVQGDSDNVSTIG